MSGWGGGGGDAFASIRFAELLCSAWVEHSSNCAFLAAGVAINERAELSSQFRIGCGQSAWAVWASELERERGRANGRARERVAVRVC